MAIFSNISNFIGGLLSGSGKKQIASVGDALSGTYTGAPLNRGTAGYSDPNATYGPANPYPVQPPTGTQGADRTSFVPYAPYDPKAVGMTPAAKPAYMTPSPSGSSYPRSSSQSSQQYMTPSPYVFDKASGNSYARSAMVNVDLEGKTLDEADKAIAMMKSNQASQSTANTSAVFSNPNAVSNTIKNLDSFKLSTDEISKDTWSSIGTKQEKINNQLKATTDEIIKNYDTPEAFATDIQNNIELQQKLEPLLKYGLQPSDIISRISNKATSSSNMSTGDYMLKLSNDKAMDQAFPESALIQDQIAKQQNIPQQMKDLYFGTEKEVGYLQQKINLEQNKIDLWKEKLADEKATNREKLNFEIAKNNAEAELTRNKIKQNKLNAKNYLVGMLSKLGALNTTSAAGEGIVALDQKYEQQEMELDSKLKFANQALEIEARNKINDYENTVNDKIQAIKEDLSKDTNDVLKDITKVQRESDKEVFNLRLKLANQMKKNNSTFEQNYKNLSEDYITKFNALVTSDFGGTGSFSPAEVARELTVPMSKADKTISNQIKINDPKAIIYFKSLPADFRSQWVQYSTTQPLDKYFTINDLKMAYEAYLSDKQMPTVKNKTINNVREI